MIAVATNIDALDFVLQLAEQERRMRDSSQWKFDLDAAFDAHSEAVENLYRELYRLLDERACIGDPVHPPKLPPDPRKELKKQIVAALKAELPGMVSSIIDQF